MNKTFTFAGVSRKNDEEFRVRCANSPTYVKVLIADGHKDIDLIELKEPMLKEDVIAYLISIDFDNGRDDVRQALEMAVEKYSVPAEKAPRVKAQRPTKVKPTLESIAAKAPAKVTPQVPAIPGMTPLGIKARAELEEAPF